VPKITVSMGLNVALSEGDRYSRFTPSITVAEIDTDGDVKEQIDASLKTGKQVWDAISNLLEEQVNEELGRAVK